ncbi:MAG: hypothetical protein NTY00_02975 [Deltaproteobacteria bacterium]|nr:hypothetical protein [Deltaproteobacteria bacterium]
MSTKEVYKQKVKTELERVQAKLAEFEAPEKSLSADTHIKHANQFDNLKEKIDVTKTNKDFWDLLRYCF